MHAKRISKWLSESELKIHLNDQSILQWLLEDGSITQKISADGAFKLEVLQDGIRLAAWMTIEQLMFFPNQLE